MQLKPHNTVLLYKRDLSRYFRQIPLCPMDYSLVGMRWENQLYFDKFFPMGITSACYVAQRVSTSIVFIHQSFGFWLCNYIDDLCSAETAQVAWHSYHMLEKILKDIGATESKAKATPPSTRMEFLRTIVDTENMTLEVSQQRMQQLQDELQCWNKWSTASKKQLQSLIGKLNFVTNCVRASRVFLNRMIHSLNEFPERGRITIPSELKRDVTWWLKFLSVYNGVSILWLCDAVTVNHWLATDACLTAGGGHCEGEYFHVKFNETIMQETQHISQRELLTVVIALKLWAPKLRGKIVRLQQPSISMDCEPG